MTIQNIIKKAVKRLELEGKLLTPDAYAEAFCKEADKAGTSTEDCNQVDKYIKSMSKDLQKELVQYRIKNMQELTRFLISKLSRMNTTINAELLESQSVLMKRILQVIEVLHNKDASDLAKKLQELLKSNPSAAQMDQFRQLWINFLTTYNDSFLNTLSSLGDIDTNNLKKSIENLNISSGKISSSPKLNLTEISSLIISSLVPSIASSANDKISNTSEKIKNNPALLDSQDMCSEIKSAILFRIALDKDSVKEMVESIDGVLDKLSLRLIDMIEKSDNSTVEIRKIKSELESNNESDTLNFKVAHKKLFTIALALEENTQLLSKDLKDHNGEINQLAKKIKKLEKDLKSAKQESREDFLTKLYNKRALDEFMLIKEEEFKRYSHNFSIVMFDLDKFKDVNDTYGHDAGDAVLSAFAKIIKDEGRSVDIIGRFGGEEFLAILSETDTKGGVIFAQKVRIHVQKAKFMYKNKRINVTVSAGVSERAIHISLDGVIKSADEYLYQAKYDGRDQVAYKK